MINKNKITWYFNMYSIVYEGLSTNFRYSMYSNNKYINTICIINYNDNIMIANSILNFAQPKLYKIF